LLGILLTWLLLLLLGWRCVVGLGVETNPYAVLEIDLGPFNRNFPRLNMSQYIGQGVTFLNRHLSSSMFQVQSTIHLPAIPLPTSPFSGCMLASVRGIVYIGTLLAACVQRRAASSLLLSQCHTQPVSSHMCQLGC
jgi:hypothetical protein